MTAQDTERPVRTYAGFVDERRTYAFGLTPFSFAVIAAIVLVTLALMFITGSALGSLGFGAVLALLWVPLVVKGPQGKTGYEMLLLRRQWRRQRRTGRHIYRAGQLSNQAGGRSRLPGIAAETELWWALDTNGHRFGMMRMPSTHQYTVLLRCRIGGAAGNDQHIVDGLVGSWANFLAMLGQVPNIAAAAVTIETLPDTGERARANVDAITHPDSPATARQILAERVAASATGFRVHGRVAITFDAATPAQRKDPMAAAEMIGAQLPVLYSQLAHTDVTALPMSDSEYAAVVRRAFDPAAEPDIERALTLGEYVCDWADAGPITAEEDVDKVTYRHDSGISRVWTMTSPPSGFPTERVLAGLLSPNSQVPRKRVTEIFRPYSPADAAKTVEGDFKSAVTAVNTARGIGSATADIALESTNTARVAEARGHGLVSMSMVITATAESVEELTALDPEMRGLISGARITARPAYMYQAAAFLGGLGIGVLLPDHSTIPRSLRG